MLKYIITIAMAIYSIWSVKDAVKSEGKNRAWNIALASISGLIAVFFFVSILSPVFSNWVFANKVPITWISALVAVVVIIVGHKRKDDHEDYDRLAKTIAAIVLALCVGVVATGYADIIPADNVSASDEVVEEEPVFSGTFYNDELQNDGNSDNDFNFGYNRYKAAKKSDEKIVDWLDEDFKASIKEDPALAAATMAYADSIIGTRYIGEFYDSAKKDWSLAINTAKDKFIEDEELYSETVDKFIEMLETNAEVSVGEVDTYKDQMYMNPNKYTMNTNGSPDVIALKTDQNTGHFLTYSINIKGNKFDVNYRVECGYQPTDVEKTMGIKTTTKAKAKQPKPNTGGKGDPDPEKGYKKDPSKDPVYQGNAEKGGGKNLDDGPGEYQPTKPEHATDTRTTDDSKSGGGNSSAPATDPIPVHGDSHDTGGKGAGDNNGEFKM